MASQYDITFLRLLMEQQLTEKPQAMRCLQVIDEQAQRGQQLNAAQVAVRMGLVNQEVAQRFDVMTRTELQRGAPPAGTGRYPAPGGPAPAPSGQFRPPGPPGSASGSFRRPGPPPHPGGPPPHPGGPPSHLGGPPPHPGGQHPSGQHPRPTGQHPRPSGQHPRPTGQHPRPSGQHPRPGGQPPIPGQAPAGQHPQPGRVPSGQHPRPGTGQQQRPTGRHGPPGAAPTGTHVRPAGGSARQSGSQPTASGRVGGFQDMGGELAGVECGPKIGRGPVGTSYEGRRQGQPAVVKVLSRRFAQHAGLIERLMGDARAFQGFKHANLAALLQVGSTEGRDVLVFEKARGRPLHQVVAEKGPLGPSAALRVVYDVAQVLSEAPKACGDVRAEKIFFDGQRAQLVDLGLARAASLGAGHGAHGLPYGDPRYLAPEVMQEEQAEPTAAADVYALGVLLYYLVCGKLPFEGEPQEVLGKHLESLLPPPPKNVSFSTKIAALILRMTAKSPSQRIPDPKTVVEVITQLLEGKPLTLPPIAAEPGQPEVEVDEFDPNELSMDEGEISADKWEATSRPMARHGSGEWDRKKIAAARGKGPQLATMASDDALSPMQAAIAEATGERPTSSRRMRVGKSGRVPAAGSATSSKRAAGATGVSDRPRKAKATDKRGLLRALGGILAVVAVMVGIALIPEPEPEPIVNQETGEVWAPPPPPPLETVEDLEIVAKEAEAKLSEYAGRVDSRIENRQFQEALKLSEELPAELRETQQGAGAIKLAETRIREAARNETDQAAARIRDLIATGQFERAKREAKRLEEWVIDPKIIESLQGEADAAFLDRHRAVKELKAVGPFDFRQADRWLRTNLKGTTWGKSSRIYNEGGLLLDYSQLNQAAFQDLTSLHQDRMGPAPILANAGRLGTAIKLAGSEGQVTLLLPLKWAQVLDAAIEFVVNDKVAPDSPADLAICMGVDHRGRSGVGLSWGTIPLTLKPGRTERSMLPGMAIQNFQSQARYRLELRALAGEGTTTYEGVLTNLVKQTVQEGRFSVDQSSKGYVAIVVRGVDVGLLGVEVRGVPEAAQFQPKQ